MRKHFVGLISCMLLLLFPASVFAAGEGGGSGTSDTWLALLIVAGSLIWAAWFLKKQKKH
jgi:LPXTG-motif cell wall-anchored protein